MNLYLFTDKLSNKVTEFMTWWELKHDEEGDSFPMKMNPADWHEQFIVWLSLEDGA